MLDSVAADGGEEAKQHHVAVQGRVHPELQRETLVRSGSGRHRLEALCQQRLLTAEPLLKSTLPLENCLRNINSSARCIG